MNHAVWIEVDSGILGEGESDHNWPVENEYEDGDSADSTTADFAPRGASRFQERIRKKLPKPLDVKTTRQSEALGRLYDACSV